MRDRDTGDAAVRVGFCMIVKVWEGGGVFLGKDATEKCDKCGIS